MAEFFTARGLPVPPELTQHPLTNWRRNAVLALTILTIAVGLRITNIDLSYANPDYAGRQVAQLFNWDTRILTPQNELETYWDTAEGLMLVTIFLGIIATVFAIVIALPISFLWARNIMAGNRISMAVYTVVRLFFTVVRSIDVLIVVIVMSILFGIGSAAGVVGLALHNLVVHRRLYSGAIQGIDRDPIEANTGTGANGFKVIWPAVLAQIVN